MGSFAPPTPNETAGDPVGLDPEAVLKLIRLRDPRGIATAPLLTALDAGHPAGIVTVSSQCVRGAEVRAGAARIVVSRSRGRLLDHPDPIVGPTVLPWQRPRSREDCRDHFLRSAGNQVARIAMANGWDAVVLCGEPHSVATIRSRLPADGRVDSLEVLQGPALHPRADLAGELIGRLQSSMRDRQVRLVSRVVDEAVAGGWATVGASATLEAFRNVRVSRLVFDPQKSSLMVTPILEDSLARGVRLTPLHRDAAELLTRHDGLGAVLRW